MPSVWVMVLSNVLNLLGNWFFVFYLDLGFTGSPIATSSSRIISCILLVGHTLYTFSIIHAQKGTLAAMSIILLIESQTVGKSW